MKAQEIAGQFEWLLSRLRRSARRVESADAALKELRRRLEQEASQLANDVLRNGRKNDSAVLSARAEIRAWIAKRLRVLHSSQVVGVSESGTEEQYLTKRRRIAAWAVVKWLESLRTLEERPVTTEWLRMQVEAGRIAHRALGSVLFPLSGRRASRRGISRALVLILLYERVHSQNQVEISAWLEDAFSFGGMQISLERLKSGIEQSFLSTVELLDSIAESLETARIQGESEIADLESRLAVNL